MQFDVKCNARRLFVLVDIHLYLKEKEKIQLISQMFYVYCGKAFSKRRMRLQTLLHCIPDGEMASHFDVAVK